MNLFETFASKHLPKVTILLLLVIFYNTCGNPVRVTNKRVETLSIKIDSLQKVMITKKDLQIEGLKSEKRMIQSTDRKMMDVQRQSNIDAEIRLLEK